MQKHLRAVSIDLDYVCTGHKSNYSPEYSSEDQRKGPEMLELLQMADINEWCRWTVCFNERNGTDTDNEILMRVSVAVRPPAISSASEAAAGRAEEESGAKLPSAPSSETVPHGLRVKVKELS